MGSQYVELGATFIRQWWPVEEGVLQFIEYRPDELSLTLADSVEIAKRMLFAEHIPNGTFVLRGTLTPEHFANLGINEFSIPELKVDLSQALGILN